MTRIVMTYELAMAAATDKANRNMQAAGRVAWNVDDWNVMCEEFDRLFPPETYREWCRLGQPRNMRVIR